MSKFESIWERLEPEAIRLRKEGLTPQQVCTKLAWEEFNEKNKFNTVKGWYQRTFSDWPSKEASTNLNAHQQPQSNIPCQHQQAGHDPYHYHSEINPVVFLPQYQQNHLSNYRVQQASISPSFQLSNDFPHEASRQNQQLQGVASQASFQQGLCQCPATELFQHPSSEGFHGMRRQGGHQNHPNTIASHIPSRPFGSPHRQYAPQDQYWGQYWDASQSPAGENQQYPQQDHTQYRQHSVSQDAQQAPEGGHPARHDSLPVADGQFGRDTPQKFWSYEENLASFQLPLEPGSFENGLNSHHSVHMDNNDRGVHLPVHSQQFTMQSAIAPNKFVLPLEGQGFNTQPSNHRSLPASVTGPFALCSSNIHPVYGSPNHQYSNGAVAVQDERPQASAKHSRSNSIFSNSPSPPQHPLLPVSPSKFRVIHKGPNQPWGPIRMDGNNIVKVNPNKFSTDRCRKRARGKIGSEARDSITVYQEHHLEEICAIPRGSPMSYTAQTSVARNPLMNRPINSSSKVSVHSSLRDSGYISFDSEMLESVRSSLSSFTLTDDPILNTDYKEDDEGNVEVEVIAKCRFRKSYIKKRDPSICPIDG